MIEDEVPDLIIEFPFYEIREFIDSENLIDIETYSWNDAHKWLSNDNIEFINNDWNNSNLVRYISDKNISKKLSI